MSALLSFWRWTCLIYALSILELADESRAATGGRNKSTPPMRGAPMLRFPRGVGVGG